MSFLRTAGGTGCGRTYSTVMHHAHCGWIGWLSVKLTTGP